MAGARVTSQEHIDRLVRDRRTFERFFIRPEMSNDERNKAEARARSRIVNAGTRAGLKVRTEVGQDITSAYIAGYVKEES